MIMNMMNVNIMLRPAKSMAYILWLIPWLALALMIPLTVLATMPETVPATALATMPAQNAKQTTDLLKPFDHTYDLQIQSGLRLSGTLIRKLTRINAQKNMWQFAVIAKASLGLNSRIVSDFVYTKQQTRTVKLLEKKPGWGSGKPETMVFEPTSATLLDKANIQIQLMLDLKNDVDISKRVYKVWDKDGYKDYQFRMNGREKITTPAGSFETVRVATVLEANQQEHQERLFWFAPEHDYLLIKYYQKHKDTTYRAILVR